MMFWWARDVTHLSKPLECTTPNVNPNVNYELGVIMCHCGLYWVLCSGSYKMEIKVSARLTLQFLGRLCFSVQLALQTSVPYGCKSEVPISFLAVS